MKYYKRDQILIDRSFSDFNPLIFGEEDCKPSHSFGPSVRKYTLIHYVRKGKGTLYKNGKAYPVHAGEIFVILPGEVTVYTADAHDPWSYRWIGFDGALSTRFADFDPVLSVSESFFPSVEELSEMGGMSEFLLAGKLFQMLSELLAEKKHRNHYVRQVRDYIKSSYMNEIRVEQIAENLNLDRRYLSRLFKKKMGQTIQEYLIIVRMDEAKRYLAEGRSVSETATLCGYTDTCNFSKMFKRVCGISPANWCKDVTQNERG